MKGFMGTKNYEMEPIAMKAKQAAKKGIRKSQNSAKRQEGCLANPPKYS